MTTEKKTSKPPDKGDMIYVLDIAADSPTADVSEGTMLVNCVPVSQVRPFLQSHAVGIEYGKDEEGYTIFQNYFMENFDWFRDENDALRFVGQVEDNEGKTVWWEQRSEFHQMEESGKTMVS